MSALGWHATYRTWCGYLIWEALGCTHLSLELAASSPLASPRWGRLLRCVKDPRLFYSFGPCPCLETIAAMVAHPGVLVAIAKRTALCESSEVGSYWVEAIAGQPRCHVRLW
jgi:hypothetical protein